VEEGDETGIRFANILEIGTQKVVLSVF